MKNNAIEIENLSKQYRLGVISTGTLVRDISSIYAKYFDKDDPNSFVMESHNAKPSVNSKIWALKNINMEVANGEILGIIGKNGAGKSTLLKILARITTPTSGRARIRGRLASLLEVGTGFHPELTGRENIFLNGAILGMKKEEIKNKLEDIIAFSQIEAHINTPVKRYSSGMKVRLAFSVAAHLEPEILLIDEVLAVGDASFQDKCLNKMNSISQTGRTILFVSHQLHWINELCSRCISIDKGQISMDGKPKDVIEKYLETEDQKKSQKGIIYLSNPNYDFNTGALKISTIELQDENGKPKNEFYFKEDITVKLTLNIKKNLKNCSIYVMIGDLRGKIILYSESGSIGSFKGDIKIGKHESITRLTSKMLPGVFSIYVGVGEENGQTLEWLERVFDFKVLRVGINPESNYRWDNVHGSVNDNSKWEIKEVA
tara:strand:- start:6726 stop:8021 length:1296 start_codon:yes stop_codon:yes gene_type:complete